jgi:hypothetical protein
MEQVKYFFSCILTPITGLMNFGKNISTTDENEMEEENKEQEEPCEITNFIQCALCKKDCSLAMG